MEKDINRGNIFLSQKLNITEQELHRQTSTNLNDWLNVDIFTEVHKSIPKETRNNLEY